MKKNFLLILLSFFIFNNISAQTEIWLDDGTVINAVNIDCQIDSGYVKFDNSKGKTKYIDTLDIFAVIQQADTIFIYNNPDYPLEKAKMFMKGQIDGKNYKNIYVYSGAFVTGVASPFLLEIIGVSSFWSPLVSGIYIASFSKVNTDSKFCNIPDDLKNNDDYIAGYKYSASRKKIMNSTIFSTVGLVTGITILTIIKQ